MTQDGELVVRGGPGGTAVNLAELAELAGRLEEAARALRGAARALGVLAERLDGAAELAPFAHARAVASLRVAEASAAALAAVVEGLADGARHARTTYHEAEESALAASRGIPGPGRLLAGLPWRLPFGLDAPHLVLRTAGWGLSVLPPSRPAVAVGVVGKPGAPTGVLTGAADLLEQVGALHPASGGEPGAVEVRRVDHADGRTSWSVLIPGTQVLWPGGVNPMDNATNLQEFVGAPSAIGAAVGAALHMAGARRGQPVLLAGHSQGGLVAMRLAADPRFRRRYDVTTVLTAGSPVGHIPAPSGVSALHLEHVRDVVPALDDAPNPDRPHRVTVVRDAGAGGNPHSASTYAGTAALADASSHPSLRAWRQRARAILGGDGATVTRTVYAARRR